MGSNNKSEKFWDRMAKSYDKEERSDEHIILKIIEKTRTFLASSNTILDYGCGTGLVSNKLIS